MCGWIKKYWFLTGLLLVFVVTVADVTENVSVLGKWFNLHHGPDIMIVVIFFFSGLLLEARQIRSGIQDVKATAIALFIIFLISPLTAVLLGLVSIDTGIQIGIFLVAVMPTTLSSGVVMTGAAGGNMAHALVITILANGLSVFSIPIALSLLMQVAGGTTAVSINKAAIMLKLAGLVVLPLCAGLLIKYYVKKILNRLDRKLHLLNQCAILIIVWMALSQTRQEIMSSGEDIGLIVLLVFVFHGILLAAAGFFVWRFHLGPGRRESVIFMGAQKTLPLSVILQISLFPQYGLALVVCVVHHIVHLFMDSYLVVKLRS